MNVPQTHPFGNLDAKTHQDALTLLEQVAAYLRSLPPHPMHRAMEQRIVQHLHNPSAQAQKERLALLASAQAWDAKIRAGVGFKGVSGYAPTGVPMIAVRLVYPELQLVAPSISTPSHPDKLVAQIGQQLGAGVKITMSPIEQRVDRAWCEEGLFSDDEPKPGGGHGA